ncbi:sensor histidine kinase [Brevibacterium aurantiacum]|uniref:sensor histidine kinase n=1 Tax=Brevibacterium aurantiacum TaxID=273384 RepID=UPI001866C117|nr:histidine kinase [Brevibacterium aurantiacum]
MKTVITWLWLLPLPLTFALEVLTGSGWLVIIADLFALATALPILIRTQRAAAGVTRPQISLLPFAALALILALIPVAAASTLSPTVMWLSLVTVVMLSRWFATGLQLLLLILLSVGNVVVPGLIPDGITFAFGASTVIVASLSLGLLLRMVDRSLLERQATAAEAERRRMATELHDLVAHEVTGIVVLSQAAARSEDAGILRTALSKIEESGTRALEEIRSLVSDTTSVPGDSGARSPVVSGLQGLVDRANGFAEAEDLTLDLNGTDTEAVPTTIWPVLDRVLAEALTNIRRHAGSRVPITVRLLTITSAMPDDGSRRDIILTVINGPSAGGTGAGGIGAGSGTGLHGLRTRVDHLGGDLFAGPSHDGGWVLETRLPLNP